MNGPAFGALLEGHAKSLKEQASAHQSSITVVSAAASEVIIRETASSFLRKEAGVDTRAMPACPRTSSTLRWLWTFNLSPLVLPLLDQGKC